MHPLFATTPRLKKLSILVGAVAALVAADTLTRQYHAKQAKLEYLCTYRFAGNCQCASTDTACLSKCASLRESQRAPCMEELKPSFYKLQDDFTWRLIIWLPIVYCLAVLAIHIMGWVFVKLFKAGS